MDMKQLATEHARRQQEQMSWKDIPRTEGEIQENLTSSRLSQPDGSSMILDSCSPMGHGEADNSTGILGASVKHVGEVPMKGLAEDILKRYPECITTDDTVEREAADGTVCRESCDGKSCRYILGKPSKTGDNIIVIGANPSSAGLVKSDQTMDNIVKTVARLGAKGYVVLNLWPDRSGNPDLLPNEAEASRAVMGENLRAFADVLAKPYMKEAGVWAAWGGLIEKRPYMVESLRLIVAIFKGSGHRGNWFQMGESTKDGHPRHPNPRIKKPELLPWNMQPRKFDVDEYLASFDRP